MIKNWRKDLINLSSLLSIMLLGSLYMFFNKPGDRVYTLITSLDLNIPVIKVFVVPYMLWYLFIMVSFVFIYFKNKELFFKTLVSYNVCLLICYAIYFLVQTTVPRPILLGDDFFTQALNWVYANDKPYNCFPSIHCFTSYLMAVAVFQLDNIKLRTKAIFGLSAFIIILSTVFVKQHVVLDIISAVFVAQIVFVLVYFHKYSYKEAYESFKAKKVLKSLIKMVSE